MKPKKKATRIVKKTKRAIVLLGLSASEASKSIDILTKAISLFVKNPLSSEEIANKLANIEINFKISKIELK